jgi:hypothetical protein
MSARLQRFTQIRQDEVAPVLASALSFFFIVTALIDACRRRDAPARFLPMTRSRIG